MAAVLGACAPRAPEPVPPPRILRGPAPEAPAGPSTPGPELALGPIRHTLSADGQSVFVQGKVRNRGARPTRQVLIIISGLDAGGRTLVRVQTHPTPELISSGRSAEYLARLPNHPGVRTYHVEASAK